MNMESIDRIARKVCVVSFVVVIAYCLMGCGTVRKLCVEQCTQQLKSGCMVAKSTEQQAKAVDAPSECELACDALGALVGRPCAAACMGWCRAEGYPAEGCRSACVAVCGGDNE